MEKVSFSITQMLAGAAAVEKALPCNNYINTKLKIIKNRSYNERFFIGY